MALGKLFAVGAAVFLPLGLYFLGGKSAKAATPKPAPSPGGGGSSPSIPLEKMTCEQALGLLDATISGPTAALLAAPRTPENMANAKKLAEGFRTTAPKAPEPYSGAMRKLADCLDEFAKDTGGGTGGGPKIDPSVLKDPDGVPASWDGGPPKPGYASNPKFQWLAAVKEGDSAWVIATRTFGKGATIQRVVELIQNNPTEYYSGRPMPTKGDPKNPNSTGYNWVSLLPGDRLRIPKTWNRWIDQEGRYRGDPAPFPNP